MTFKEAFKFPLRNERYGSFLHQADGDPVANFLFSDPDKRKRLVSIINGSAEPTQPHICEYVEGRITCDSQKLLLMRGWGYLTGIGGLNLPPEEAAQIQDDFAAFIIQRLTSFSNQSSIE